MIHFPDAIRDQLNRYRADDNTYDCIVPFSGGKDSSLLLYVLAKETNLRILAFTLDYWFMSPHAWDNIRTVLKSVGADYLIIRPNWNLAQTMYQKALYEAGEICIVCEALLAANIYRIAIEKHIPAIVWALVEGQFRTPPTWVTKLDTRHLEKVHRRFVQPLGIICGEDSLEFKHFEKAYSFERYLRMYKQIEFPDDVFPYLGMRYDSDEVERVVSSIGWKRPPDIGGISSNCLACHLHNYLKKQRYSKEALLESVLELVEKRLISYERAMKVLERQENVEMAQSILREIGVALSLEEYSKMVKCVERRLR